MSRIIVKNLPKKIAANKLQELFSSKGCVTDLQLKYTKDGTFRQFAFVGYKTEEEAQAAKEYFHGTYVNASKIQVEVCANLGDANKPKSWSKHSKEKVLAKGNSGEAPESSENKDKDDHEKKKEGKTGKKSDFPEELLKNPRFKEFLEVNKIRSSKPIWADDAVDLENEEEPEDDDVPIGEKEAEKSASDEDSPDDKSQNLAKNKAVSDKEYLKSKMISSSEAKEEKPNEAIKEIDTPTKVEDKTQTAKVFDDRFTVKLRNLPFHCKKKQIRKFLHPLKPQSLRIPPKAKGFAYVKFGSEKEMKQALNKHKGFLEGHRIDVVKYEKKSTHQDSEAHNDEAKKLEDQELLAESGRIFIRNLCFDVTEEEVEKLFSKYGPLAEVHLPVDSYSKKGLGFAFVSFVFAEHAVKAFAEMDGTIFQGRLLHLIPGKPKKEANVDINELPFKKKKAAKLKALSGSSHNWNTLFLGLNTVADVMSEQYNIEKSTLLNEEKGESIPVRMALGETQLVVETRDFLLRNGVELDSFSQPAAERSKTVMIVKNLPAKTPPSEINEVFSKYGVVSRVILPPCGVTALVEFQHPTEAKTAFRKLAYSRFHHMPLYLEWAPMNVFKEDSSPKDDPAADNASEPPKDGDVSANNQSKDGKEETTAEEDELIPELGTTLFVKNLNFETTEESLKKHFKKCGALHSVLISKKKAPDSGKLLSMGFGFVQFRDKSSATRALQDMQYSELDGRKLELKFSNRATIVTAETARRKAMAQEQKTSKILVRNIPFEITEREVRDLFKEFGNLKSVRLPKKMSGDGTHRGFGFVDFVSKSCAKRAFNALCHSTHLLGRRLVLEWANPDSDDVTELRKKTARDFYQGGPPKKLKKSKLVEDVMLASARTNDDDSD